MGTERLNYNADNDLSLIAYHVDYPDGREVDLNYTDLREIAKQGWVDHPAKIGLNPWDTDERIIARIKAAFEQGETEAFDFDYMETIVRTRKENEGAQEREERRFREQRVKDAGTIEEEARTSDERLADERSDADKLRRREGGVSHNLVSAVRQSELAHAGQQNGNGDAPQGGDKEPTEEQQEEFLLHRNMLVEHGAALGISLEEIEALMKANSLDLDALNRAQYAQSCDAVTEMAKIPVDKRKIKKSLQPQQS